MSFLAGRSPQPVQNAPGYQQPQQQVYPSLPGQQALHPWQVQPSQSQQLQVVPNAGPSYLHGQPQTQGQVQQGFHGQMVSAQTQAPGAQGLVQPWQAQGSYAGAVGVPGTLQPSLIPRPVIPQALESVSPDEDPVYGPLGRARGKVERALGSDDEISPDLADRIPDPQLGYLPVPPASCFKPFKITRNVPLPDALHQELNFKHLTAKMGLFEDIERAWFTVDNKLFLWDYEDGRDFNRYDEQADTIQSVGLVKVRPDVFIDELSHLLVICTSTRVSVLGLGRPTKGEISLFVTNLAADTPTPIVQVSGTASGRIFMLGLNKDLYELEYSNDSNWFFGSGAKIKVTNRSSGALSNWIPTVWSSGPREGVERFVIDSAQGRLFTLHTKGEIEYYDISNGRFESRARYGRLKQDLIAKGLAGQAPQYAGANIVSIAAVGAHESRSYCLVAITANGTRVYFSSLRFSPALFRAPQTAGLNLSEQSLYSSGTTLGVQLDTTSVTASTQLHILALDVGRQSAARENNELIEPPYFQEYSLGEVIPAEVWSVVEVPATNPAYSPPSLCRQSDRLIALNPLARQATTESRSFLILATSGLYFAVMPRPIDILQAALDADKDTGYELLKGAYGRTQVTAMGIAMGALADSTQGEMANLVTSIILNGGEPIVRDSTSGRHIYYSSRHDALALVIARYLRSIWNARVTVPIAGGRQMLGVTESALLAVQARLDSLKEYTDEHPFPSHRAEGEKKIAWDQEELSLDGLYKLVKQAIEAISFVLLLNDYKLPDIVARCEPNVQATLANITFKDLFTSGPARDIAKKLVTALIEQQIGQELGIDSLSDVLQKRCGTFCQPGDVVLYKAEESMRRAESSRDPLDRQEHLGEALRMFTRAAANLPIPRLQTVANRFRALQYVPGAIELPLDTATAVDPNGKAYDYDRAGRHPADPRKQWFELRQECYECVITALAQFDELLNQGVASGNPGPATIKRDEAYSIAIASDDELFHFYLYDWTVKSHRPEQLLEYDTPFIEEYLKRTSNDVEDRRDLLWKYYARREEYMSASRALNDLATRPSPMSLGERTYYLAQALASAKSAGSLDADDVEFAGAVQERLDVSQVQVEVARAIEAHPDMQPEEKEVVLVNLNGDLLGLNELYQEYARPYRLFEQILLILKTADTRLDEVVEAVWRQLLAGAPGTPASDAMAEVILDLVRKYYPSEAAPLEIVLPVVYTESFNVSAGSTEGWATNALLDGGVPLRECWEELISLHERAQREEEREYYTEELGVVAERWVHDRESIPLADVERFVSAYLLRATAGLLDERQVRTRDRMSRAKDAIKKW